MPPMLPAELSETMPTPLVDVMEPLSEPVRLSVPAETVVASL